MPDHAATQAIRATIKPRFTGGIWRVATRVHTIPHAGVPDETALPRVRAKVVSRKALGLPFPKSGCFGGRDNP